MSLPKIGIVAINAKYIHASLAPWCLLAGTQAYTTTPHQAIVIEGTINQPDLLDKLTKDEYALLGIGCYIWNIELVKKLLPELRKQHPNTVIVLGGPEVSYHPSEVLRACPDADYILGGEGERTFAKLVDQVLQGVPCEVEGLTAQGGEPSPPHSPTEIPLSPYTERYFQALGGRISYMESARGCPYACAFCLSGGREVVRYYPMERVKAEILQLANCGSRTVKFIDRTFNSSTAHADEIFRFILAEFGKNIPTNLCFHFEMAGDILRESTLELISQMPRGYIQIEIGMQSFCEKTLEAVGRKTNISLLIKNIQRLVSFGNHHLHIDLIAGLPYEGMEEFANSFHIAYGLGADMLQLGFLKVLHGSQIGENREKYPCEYAKTAPYQVTQTPWLSPQELAQLSGVEECVDRLYNSGRFSRTLSYLLEVSSMPPFALYMALAEGLEHADTTSLDRYTDAVFGVCSHLTGVCPTKLRDVMVLDRVETNSTCILPQSLRIYDPKLKELTKLLQQNPQTATPKGGKRFVGILYHSNQGVYVDYPTKSQSKSHFKEKFQPKFCTLPCLGEEN